MGLTCAKRPPPQAEKKEMAAQTRNRASWDQVGTVDRHKGAVDKRKQLKDLDYHRRQLQKELEQIEDEYSKAQSEKENQQWRSEGPRSPQNKRASWSGYDDNKPNPGYYGNRGHVGTIPRSRTSLADYRPPPASQQEKFKVDIDVHEFRPEDVRIKVEDTGDLSVEAKREDSRGSKFSTLERRSKVRLPKEVDSSRLSAIYSSSEGVLTIQAPRFPNSPSSPKSPQSPRDHNQIPFADQEPAYRDHPTYGSSPDYGYGSPPPVRASNHPLSDTIPYYMDDNQALQARPQSPDSRHEYPITIAPGRQNSSPLYSPSADDVDAGPRYESLYAPVKKDKKARSKSTPPGGGKPVIHRAIRDRVPDHRRSRPLSDEIQKPPPSSEQDAPLTDLNTNDLPPHMGRLTISLTLGKGYTPDQVIVKNVMNYNKFIVFAKGDGIHGKKTFRHIFNWPALINPSTIYAFLKKDGVLHVSAMPIVEPE